MPPKTLESFEFTVNKKGKATVHVTYDVEPGTVEWFNQFSPNQISIMHSVLVTDYVNQMKARGDAANVQFKADLLKCVKGGNDDLLGTLGKELHKLQEGLVNKRDEERMELRQAMLALERQAAEQMSEMKQRMLDLEQRAVERIREMENRMKEAEHRAEHEQKQNKILTEVYMETKKRLEISESKAEVKSKVSAVQGNAGEAIIEELLNNWFKDYKYYSERTGNIGNKSGGDVRLHIGNEGHYVSVEVKNAINVTHDDVIKTMDHVRGLVAKEGDMHVAHVFVSLKKENIPGKGSFMIDMTSVQNKLMVFVGVPNITDEKNKETVRRAMEVAINYLPVHQYIRNGGGESKYQELQRRLKEIGMKWQERISVYSDGLSDLEEIMKTSDKLSRNLKATLNGLVKDYTELCNMASIDLQSQPIKASKRARKLVAESLEGSEITCHDTTLTSDECSGEGVSSRQAGLYMCQHNVGRKTNVRD